MKLIFLALLTALVSRAVTLQAQKHSIAADTTLARNYYKQALELQKMGKYDSSNILLKKTIFLYKQHRQWKKKLDTENKLSFNLAQLGQYEQALQQAEHTLAETIIKLREGTIIEASTYNNLGIVYENKGEYDKALEYYQKALQIYINALGESHLNTAKTYSNLGIVYELKGEYNKAQEFHQKALQIKILILGATHSDVATSYNNLGIIYWRRTQYDKALEYHQKALQIKVKALGESHTLVADSYSNLGLVYEVKGENDKALEYYQKALQIYSKAHGEFHSDVANTYNNIGNIYFSNGDYNMAVEYYQKTLQIYRKILGETHPYIADLYNNLGVIYGSKAEHNKSLEYFQKALQVYIEILGKFHPYISGTYNNIGNVYELKGESTKALMSYQQGILANTPTFRDTLFAHNPSLSSHDMSYLDGGLLLTSLLGKARTLTKLSSTATHQHLPLAYQTLCLADTLVGQVLNSISNEQDKVTFLAQATQAYQQALLACQQLYQLTEDKTYLEHAFYFAGRGKASVLSASITESKAKAFAGVADSLRAKDQQLRTYIAHYTQQIAEELSRVGEIDSSKLTEYQNSLFLAHRQQDSLVTHFERQYPKYYELKYKSNTVTPQQLQQHLDPKTAIVEYVVGDSILHLLTLTHDGFDIQTQKIDSSFHRQLTAFRNSMRLQQQDVYEDVALKLYQRLWPKNLPSKIKQVIIIPDGMLATIPFEALLIPAQRKKARHAFLLEKYTISYAYSASLLYENLTKPALQGNKHLLALAPVFADTATNTASVSTRELLEEHTRSLSAFSSTDNDANDSDSLGGRAYTSVFLKRGFLLDGRYVSALPASEEEVQALNELFKVNRGHSKVYLHGQAKEELLKSKELSSYNYVHLATHGFVDANSPELSGLLLAQDSTSEEDGILYAGEIYNLNLQAELVCLSACETGLGKLAKGEGIIGLTRALLYAGARNVAVSLWKVADESTSELMQAFYKRMLDGETKAKALQGAKLSLLSSKPYAHPYFWAPFILIGR